MTSQGRHNNSTTKPAVLAFDFNQTLIDFDALRPAFAEFFHDAAALDEWFSLLLHYSTVVTLTDSYSDFSALGRAVFSMLAEGKGLRVSEEERSRVFQAMLSLPAHPEVPEALARLRAAGFRMVVLTNSPHASVDVQIGKAGIAQYFDEVISVRLGAPLQARSRSLSVCGTASGSRDRRTDVDRRPRLGRLRRDPGGLPWSLRCAAEKAAIPAGAQAGDFRAGPASCSGCHPSLGRSRIDRASGPAEDGRATTGNRAERLRLPHTGNQRKLSWSTAIPSGRGSAWLERLVRDQEAGGSNPLAPTILPQPLLRSSDPRCAPS